MFFIDSASYFLSLYNTSTTGEKLKIPWLEEELRKADEAEKADAVAVASTTVYLGNMFCIRKATPEPFQASVTTFNSGSDSWYDLDNEFGEDHQWTRDGWEAAIIRNEDDTMRKGFYINSSGKTVYITVYSIDYITVEYALRPEDDA